ncbi:hypothetical protein BJV77DRAFT_965217 [Russula vinacea]|nr:hypothetical protein BJV77DRAFT_965217 [Russula vinacea]
MELPYFHFSLQETHHAPSVLQAIKKHVHMFSFLEHLGGPLSANTPRSLTLLKKTLWVTRLGLSPHFSRNLDLRHPRTSVSVYQVPRWAGCAVEFLLCPWFRVRQLSNKTTGIISSLSGVRYAGYAYHIGRVCADQGARDACRVVRRKADNADIAQLQGTTWLRPQGLPRNINARPKTADLAPIGKNTGHVP